MITVLEGPDGSGKTTLARILEANMRVEVYHSKRPESVYDMDRTMNDIDRMHCDGSRMYIVDRAPWISDPIYALAHDRPRLFPTEDILRWVAMPGVKIIYCSPRGLNWDNVDKAPKDHKPPHYMMKLKRTHDKIINGYDAFFDRRHKFEWIKYDYTLPDALSLVMDFIEGGSNVRIPGSKK